MTSPASKSILASSLELRPSQLYVQNLQKVTHFYAAIVGLDILEQTASHVILGHDQLPVLELISKPEFRHAPMPSAGLFHNAIVYTSRAQLVATIWNIFRQTPDAFEGSADHLVSEAFYFHDPEYNGLELYFDRPSDTWEWKDGAIKMSTLYLDPEAYILRYADERALPGKMLGHVHMRVGDIPAARKFYVDQLGFDITFAMDSALFVSVAGYHHHLAMNTWQSQGAGLRTPGLGLAEVKLILPSDTYVDNLAGRLAANQLRFNHQNGRLLVDDPWGNKLAFSAD